MKIHFDRMADKFIFALHCYFTHSDQASDNPVIEAGSRF
jgi:hypothetical protein